MKRNSLVVTMLAALLVAPSAFAKGRGFVGFGTAGWGDLVTVSTPVFPTVSFAATFPVKDRFRAGYELGALFYRNRTRRWGGEYGFGFLAGTVVSFDVHTRWTLISGGGAILSNPYSDNASGEYLPGNEGVAAAQSVREPAIRWYMTGAARYRFTERMAITFGTRNTSPFVSVGWLF